MQRGFEDTAYDLYSIDLPGSKAHGTTFVVPQGSSTETISEIANKKVDSLSGR